MLIRTTLLILSIPILLQATTITELLQSLEKRPEARLDILAIEKSALGKEAVRDKRMPKVNLFGGYEHYNTPNGLLPVVPNEMSAMLKDPAISQPFSKNILRGGVEFSWPLFVKSVYTLEEKAELLNLASKEKKKLNLIQREAVVVGSVAQLRYLESLKLALLAKRHSIKETEKSTEMKIKEGRAPESARFLLSSHINELDISLNTIDQQVNLLGAKIETLTGIALKQSIPLRRRNDIRKGEIFALRPLQKQVEASLKGVQAADEAYIPSISTKGNAVQNRADAYNNDGSLQENFAMAGLYITMPLFDSSKSTASQQSKVAYMQEKTTLEQTRHALSVQARQLSREIELLGKSIDLAQKSVSDQQKLLRIAKVSLANESITQEEYLRYEDALADAKAKLYNYHAKRWQDIAQLAVIYGNDLKEIVK
jgi:outer membrane protein TolC